MSAAISTLSGRRIQRGPLTRLVLIAGIFLVAGCLNLSAWCQAASTPSQFPVSGPTQQESTASAAAGEPKQESKTADTAAQKPVSPAEARQAQLVADTNKLYQLAQELQAEVAKSTKNTLSLAVVKKAAEVEKLAKSLKERMKDE